MDTGLRGSGWIPLLDLSSDIRSRPYDITTTSGPRNLHILLARAFPTVCYLGVSQLVWTGSGYLDARGAAVGRLRPDAIGYSVSRRAKNLLGVDDSTQPYTLTLMSFGQCTLLNVYSN